MDGFYSGNPNEDSTAKRFDVIETITPEIEEMAGDAGSGLSKGGMKTKLLAAKMATAGVPTMAITEGSTLNPLKSLEEGANCDMVHCNTRSACGAQTLDLSDEASGRDRGSG